MSGSAWGTSSYTTIRLANWLWSKESEDEDFEENEFVIPTKAIRDEGTSLHYLPASESIELTSKFVKQVEQILQDFNYRIHEVTTWTTDGFYRETVELVNHYRKLGVATVEMECAALAAFYSQRTH